MATKNRRKGQLPAPSPGFNVGAELGLFVRAARTLHLINVGESAKKQRALCGWDIGGMCDDLEKWSRHFAASTGSRTACILNPGDAVKISQSAEMRRIVKEQSSVVSFFDGENGIWGMPDRCHGVKIVVECARIAGSPPEFAKSPGSAILLPEDMYDRWMDINHLTSSEPSAEDMLLLVQITS